MIGNALFLLAKLIADCLRYVEASELISMPGWVRFVLVLRDGGIVG